MNPRIFNSRHLISRGILLTLCLIISLHLPASAQDVMANDSIVAMPEAEVPADEIIAVSDSLELAADTLANDSITANVLEVAQTDSLNNAIPEEFEQRKLFNPDPTKAVWMSALCPGLGQIYNRRYWKLPIVIGGYVGLSYATSWNARMLKDYTRAYRDIMDSDPNTKSYMDFYPSTTKEQDIDKEWLKRSLKSKKDFYRRNRDLCIISMVGLYLLCMVDAYVDASLSRFDISPNLSLQLAPTVVDSEQSRSKSLGVQCALTF